MHLREATAADASAIAALHTASWRDAYRTIFDAAYLAGPVVQDRIDVWTERFNSPSPAQHVIVAEEDGKLVGFVCVFGARDETWGSLVDNLHVLPHLKGKGAGKLLLQSGARWASRAYPSAGLHLWVYEANEGACRFYDRMGGQNVERTTKSTHGGTAPIFRYWWADPAALAAMS
jgi:GNAT superfamily N-acetyltransferase